MPGAPSASPGQPPLASALGCRCHALRGPSTKSEPAALNPLEKLTPEEDSRSRTSAFCVLATQTPRGLTDSTITQPSPAWQPVPDVLRIHEHAKVGAYHDLVQWQTGRAPAETPAGAALRIAPRRCLTSLPHPRHCRVCEHRSPRRPTWTTRCQSRCLTTSSTPPRSRSVRTVQDAATDHDVYMPRATLAPRHDKQRRPDRWSDRDEIGLQRWLRGCIFMHESARLAASSVKGPRLGPHDHGADGMRVAGPSYGRRAYART